MFNKLERLYNERLLSLRNEAGLTFGGYDDEGIEQWIGTDRQWEMFQSLKDKLDEEHNDPSETSIFHPNNL